MVSQPNSQAYRDHLFSQYENRYGKLGASGPSLSDLLRVGGAPSVTPPLITMPTQKTGITASSGGGDMNGLSGFRKFIDVVSQPMYAASQTVGEMAADTIERKRQGDSFLKAALSTNALKPGLNVKQFLSNFGEGNDKRAPSDLLRGDEIVSDEGNRAGLPGVLAPNATDGFWNKAAKFTGGLAADIALDPITYIPGGAIAAGGKGAAKGVVKGVSKIPGAEKAVIQPAAKALAPVREFSAATKAKAANKLSDLKVAATGKTKISTEELIGRLTQAGIVVPDEVISAARSGSGKVAIPRKTSKALKSVDDINKGTYVPKVSEDTLVETAALKAEPELKQMLKKSGAKNAEAVEYTEELASLLKVLKPGENTVPMYPKLQNETPESVGLVRRVEISNPHAAEFGSAKTDLEAVQGEYGVALAKAEAEVANVPSVDYTQVPDSIPPNLQAPARKAFEYFLSPERISQYSGKELMDVTKQVRSMVLSTFHRNGIPPKEAEKVATAINRRIGTIFDDMGSEFKPTGNPKAVEQVKAEFEPRIKELVDRLERVKKNYDLKDKEPKIRLAAAKPQEIERVGRELVEKFDVHPVHARELIDHIKGMKETRYVTKGKGVDSAFSRLQKAFTDGETRQYKVITVVKEDSKAKDVMDSLGVPTPEEMIERNALADTTATKFAEDIVAPTPEDIPLEEMFDGLPKEVGEALLKALGSDSTVAKQWLSTHPDFKYTTNTGVKSTSPKAGEGRHVISEEPNRFVEGNMLRNIIFDHMNNPTAMSELAGVSASASATTWAAKREAGLRVLITAADKTEKLFLKNGVHLGSGVKDSLHLPASEVLRALERSGMRASFTRNSMFTVPGKTNVAIDPIVLLEVGDDIVNYLITTKALPLNVVPKKITQSSAKELSELIRTDELTKIVRGTLERALREGGQTFGEYDAKVYAQAVDNLVDELTSRTFVGNLMYGFNNYAAKAGVTLNTKINKVSEEAMLGIMDDIAESVKSDRRMAEVLDSLTKKKIESKLKASDGSNLSAAVSKPEINQLMDPVVVKGVQDTLVETVEDVMSPQVMRQAQYLQEIAEAASRGATKDKLDIIYESYEDAVGKAFHKETVDVLNDIGDNTAVAMEAGMARILDWFGNKFLNHYQNATMHEAMLRGGNVGRLFQSHMNKQIRNLTQYGSREDIAKAFRAMQTGAVDSLENAELVNAMEEIMAPFFRVVSGPNAAGQMDAGILQSEFFARGFDIKHVTDRMSRGNTKLPESMRFDLVEAQRMSKETGRPVIVELSNQWRNWEVSDPQDFLSRMTAVFGGLATDQAIAHEGLRLAKSGNFASTTKYQGWRELKGSGVLSRYMPEGMYFDPDIAREFERMEEILSRTAMSNKVVEEYFAPVIDMWKAGMTIYNPNHHVRNLVGDMGMSFFADGVKSPKYYNRALRMLSPGKNIRGKYDGMDILQSMRGMSKEAAEGHTAARVRIKNRELRLSDEEVQRAAYERGILPDFGVTEDLNRAGDTLKEVRDANGKVVETVEINQTFRQKLQSIQPLGGKGRAAAGSISQARDDFVRLAHFIHVLENPPKKFGSTKELYDYAAARIRRFHPDGSDLTSFERAHMRKIFPFYSWMRKAIPLVLESMITNPGRHTIYPKAMYNLAEANGIDPDSLSEPFPEHKMFPDWLTEKATGPATRNSQGELVGFDIGMPDVDIANDLAAGGIRGAIGGVVGMTNPMIKAPVELLSGSRLDTGAPISDSAEYMDYTIPGSSQIASTGGVSTFGSLQNLLGGNMELDPTRAVEKENRTGFTEGKLDMLALINRLTGSRATNWETPSNIKGGQIAYRDSLGRQ